MNRDLRTVSTGSRTAVLLDDMEDEDYFRHTSGEKLNKATLFDVENLTKEHVLPKIKFISDTDEEWKWPDFANKELNSNGILNIILNGLGDNRNEPRYKMNFWTCYRKYIRKIMNDHRSNAREKMKRQILEGKIWKI